MTTMTQEDKDVLLKDLCTRLPYGIKAKIKYHDGAWELLAIYTNGTIHATRDVGYPIETYFEDCTPYLFPLSSMTEEQYYELQTISCKDCLEHMEVEKEWRNNSSFYHLPLYEYRVIDFFDRNHFDYRGLIPMGLANDATGLNIY